MTTATDHVEVMSDGQPESQRVSVAAFLATTRETFDDRS